MIDACWEVCVLAADLTPDNTVADGWRTRSAWEPIGVTPDGIAWRRRLEKRAISPVVRERASRRLPGVGTFGRSVYDRLADGPKSYRWLAGEIGVTTDKVRASAGGLVRGGWCRYAGRGMLARTTEESSS